MGDEKIMVVPHSALLGADSFTGFSPHSEVDFYSRMLEHHRFESRWGVEDDATLKQPIVYAVVVNNGKVFAYQRASKSKDYKEKRLHGKWNWGVGGHVDLVDNSDADPIRAAAMREIKEEVGLTPKDLKLLGYINLKGGVHDMHIGLLYLVETQEDIKPTEGSIVQWGWKSIEELKQMVSSKDYDVEEWSEVALKALEQKE